jgi:hypothetical protein
VPVATAVPSVALVGPESVMVKVSLASTKVSFSTGRMMLLLVSPAAKVSVPESGVPTAKSPAVVGLAPEPATVQFTVELPDVGPLRVTA